MRRSRRLEAKAGIELVTGLIGPDLPRQFNYEKMRFWKFGRQPFHNHKWCNFWFDGNTPTIWFPTH